MNREVNYRSSGTSRVPCARRDEPGGRFHQASKPVNLMKEIVAIVEPGGVVLDPFMGSGSTGVAAIEIGRRFIGIEYTEHYFDVAASRIRDVKEQE